MRHRRSVIVTLGLVGALLLTMVGDAAAQQFTRAVRIIVPFAPGGTSDILARLIGPHLSKAIGQPVVVENKPGASGNIGADFVAKAEKDGHTILLIDPGHLSAAPSLFSKLTFDVEKDLTPIGMVMFSSYILAVHPSVPAKNIAELVAYGKANPGKLNMGHAGVGTMNHLTAIILAKHWGINWKYVPYKGGAAAVQAIITNESNVIINGAVATQPFVTQNQLRGLAVSGTARLAALKDVPSFQELNLPAVDSGTWQCFMTANGAPVPVVARLNAEIRKVLAMPEIDKKISDLGGEVRTGSPEELSGWIKDKTRTLSAVIREAGIKVE